MFDEFGDQERKLWQGQFSARSLIGDWLGALLITGLLLTTTWNIPVLQNSPKVWLVTGFMIGMLWIALVGLTLHRKLSHRYELTSQRLLHRSGILNRKLRRLDLIDIDDVSYFQGPLQSMLDIGRIELTTRDQDQPRLFLPGIASVRQVAALIDHTRRIERQTRGIREQSI